MMIVDNDLLSIQQARILAENAFQAQKKLATFPQEKLDEIVKSVAEAVAEHLQGLAVLSHDETDYGRWEDKYVKNQFVCSNTRRHLWGMRCVGVIAEDSKKQITDIGVPMGVIVALCPVTSPVSTTIHNTLIAIKSGNAIIFSPHPRAEKSMSKVLDIMIEAATAKGLPEGCLAYLKPISKSGARELMNHQNTSLILMSGVPGMLPEAKASGKPVIYGGTGNGPAFIERTADIDQAVKDIIASKTFDYGIAPSAEQSVVVDACISPEVKRAFQKHGAYFMSEEDSLRLAEMFFTPDGRRRSGMVGVSAERLARRAGISVPVGVKLLVADRRYVSESDPYSRELLAPVLAYYEEDDWMHACEKCIELLLHERNAHTLVIHSRDEDVIRQFALKKPVGRLLVNTPATFGGMGATTNLFPSMTLGSGSAGNGITADNVSPMNLIYTRKVGYGVRTMETLGGANMIEKPCPESCFGAESSHPLSADTLQQILTEAIEVINAASAKK